MALVELLGPKLTKAFVGEIDTATAFEGKTAVGLYFSAHWCPPCRGFTPKLAEFYTKDLQAKGLEVVFLSSDRDEASFNEYFAEMPWLAVPYSERKTKDACSRKFKVQGIPSFVILNPTTGELITDDGRSAVMKDPTGDKLPWIPPTFAEALGTEFWSGDNKVGVEAIAGKTLGLYFSASWCPPCKAFTPQLAKWYAGMKGELGDKFEIIFCSGDQSEDEMKAYYKHHIEEGGDWLCMTYENKDNLDARFGVSGIPTFIIVGPDGKAINESARGLVPDAVAADFPWPPPLIGDIESPDKINEITSMCLMLESCDEATMASIMETVTPIAEKYKEDIAFYVAKKDGPLASRIRGMCGLPAAGQGLKGDVSPEETSMVRTASNDAPSLILMDIPDNGGYYTSKMAISLDGTGVEKMITDYKNKSLTRQQLG
jgi:nucleoredoxin